MDIKNETEQYCGIMKVNHSGIITYINDIVFELLKTDNNIINNKIYEIIPNINLTNKVLEPYTQIIIYKERKLMISNYLDSIDGQTYTNTIIIQGLDKILNNYLTENEIDFFFKVMDDNDISITDEKGIMLKVSSNYGKHYGIDNSEILGKSVYELEKKKIFYPSVTNEVLREKKKVTLLQKNIFGQSMLVTGVPIFDENNKIKYVISFHSIDIANLCDFREKYEKMIEYMTAHYAEIMELKLKKMQTKEIISKSKKMNNIYKIITNIADTNANVLITGETGVGKNLFAKLIHKESNRVEKAFVEINCGTIPENLIESELFGYEKGSFTGADIKGKIGKVELANNGTLFLDEIGELPLNMQQKLLQVIQDKKIIRVGGTKYIDVDFRLVAATNKNLVELSEKGQFREDLYYRLNVVPIHIPPLRERMEDVLLLINHFLAENNKKYNKFKVLTEDTTNALLSYYWPGNVRELENIMERLVLTTIEDKIDINNLPENINMLLPINHHKGITLKQALELYEKQLIQSAYKKYNTTIEMGKALGISQPSVVRKLKKYIPDYS